MQIIAIILFGWLLGYPILISGVPPANSISMKIVNNAGAAVEVYWVDTITGDNKLVKQTSKPLRNGTDASINSYDTHKFVARYANHREGVEAFFTKGPSEETVVVSFDEGNQNLKVKQLTKFNEIMDQIDEASVTCSSYEGDEFSNCITAQVMEEINRITDSKQEIKNYRDVMASRLRPYICSDPAVNITQRQHADSVTIDKRRYLMDVYLDTPEAKIWVVNNFITSRECDIIQKEAQPVVVPRSAVVDVNADGGGRGGWISRLAAAVTGSDGVATVEEAESDIQAGDLPRGVSRALYSLDEEFRDQDKLWRLFSHSMMIANQMGRHDLDPMADDHEPMELLTFTEGGELPTTCAGSACDGTKFKSGDRVATAMLYCQVPREGAGLTIFPKADIILQPRAFSAVFLSYKNAVTEHTDDGYTEFSMCPVSAGQQRVVNVHMRLTQPDAESSDAHFEQE